MLLDLHWHFFGWRSGLFQHVTGEISIQILLLLEFFSGNSEKAVLSQNNLATISYSPSPIHCSHATYLSRLDIAYQSSWFDAAPCCPCHPCEYVFLYRPQAQTLFKTHFPQGHNTSCPMHHLGRTDKESFTGWIKLRRVTTKPDSYP